MWDPVKENTVQRIKPGNSQPICKLKGMMRSILTMAKEALNEAQNPANYTISYTKTIIRLCDDQLVGCNTFMLHQHLSG